MKVSELIKRKYILYLVIIFFLFVGVIYFSELRHEKKYRTEVLNEELEVYTGLIHNYIQSNSINTQKRFNMLDSLLDVFHSFNYRTTIIDSSGNVLYDSHYREIDEMENHLSRPEVILSKEKEKGTDIRTSNTTGVKYYYFSRKYPDYFIRISIVYDIEARKIIEPDLFSFFLIIMLFVISSVILIFLTNKYTKSVSGLKKFALQASENKPVDDSIVFPGNELGIIGQDIVEIYRKLIRAQQELSFEKDKLIRHLNVLEEGVAIFTKEKKNIISNSHFISFIGFLSEKLVYSADDFFIINDFSQLFDFIDHHLGKNRNKNNTPEYEININKNGRFFSVKCIIFQDSTFEILILDVTKPAKRKLLKQQITDNIAHELKTPVNSIIGFLETVIEGDMDKNKKSAYIQRAFNQTCRLASLIDDISLLTKIEEAGTLYKLEKVNLKETVTSVIDDVNLKIIEREIKINVKINDSLTITGNPVLLYSIFRNLFDNALNYAGKGITVGIDMYSEDKNNYYFLFSDNGIGVPETDLPRLFERFYRVEKGRDRKSGGTGLGLAIVKNAIEFHKGSISVKNRKEGGLEFLFTLSKNLK